MNTSIIIPTYNRLNSLKRVLAGLENQTGVARSDFEVIVVSDGSIDGTNDFLRAHATSLTLRAHLQPNGGPAAARNAGIKIARGELILFLDDDVFPTPRLLAEHLRIHTAHADSAVVLGPMLTPSDFELAPWVQWEQAMLVKQYAAMQNGDWEPTARQFFTGNTSLARKHLLKQGGFDTQFRRAEDLELAFRLADAGLQFVFNAQAIGYHYAERSFTSWLGIPYAYGANDVIFAREKGQSWLLPVIWREFHNRNRLIQGLTHLCLDRPFLSRPITKLLEKTAQAAHAAGRSSMTARAYSGIFNLRYYQGVSDQLGGRAAFFAGLHANDATRTHTHSGTNLPQSPTARIDRQHI